LTFSNHAPLPVSTPTLQSLPRTSSSAKKDVSLPTRKDITVLQTDLGSLMEDAADTKRPVVKDENATSNKELEDGWDV